MDVASETRPWPLLVGSGDGQFDTDRKTTASTLPPPAWLRFSLGVTQTDKVKTGYMRGTAQAEQFGEKVRRARLKWFGHVQRRNSGYTGQRVMKMEVPDRKEKKDDLRGGS